VLPVTVCGTVEPSAFPGQAGQAPQSVEQLPQFSLKSQVPSPQEGQAPQSWLQVLQSSFQSQVPSPQTGQAPQSWLQVLQSSVQSQEPSPQTGQAPQSWLQVLQSSPASHQLLPQVTGQGVPQTVPTSLTQMASHIAEQQNGSTAQIWASQVPQLASSGSPVTHVSWQAQVPQSWLHVPQVSLGWQAPSPQTGQAPQSWLQALQSSVQSQVPSPQTGQAPQSWLQALQSSVQSHQPSPQTGQAPQSWLQEVQSSPASHIPLPQLAAHGVPQMLATSFTQMPSQAASQQNESTAQIWATQGSQLSSSGLPVVHMLCSHGQAPQSCGQPVQLSFGVHTPLPQPAHTPQSWLQEAHVSPASQAPSPQGGQSPQSCAQLVQLSSGVHTPLPQPGASGGASGGAGADPSPT
jgi:hypothetical protein